MKTFINSKRMTIMLFASAILASTVTAEIKMIKSIPSLKVIAYASAPKGNKVAVSLENKTIRIIDASNGNTLKTLQGLERPAYGLTYSPDGNKLASGDESGRIILWNPNSGKKTIEFPRAVGHTRGIQYLSFSLDGKSLASTGKDDIIKIWNAQSYKLIKTINGNGDNFNSATYTVGKLIAGTLAKGLAIYSSQNYNRTATLPGHENRGINDIDVNKQGTRAITAGRDGKAILWNLSTKKPLAKLQGHMDWVSKVCLSPTGKHAATSSSDRKVIVWSLNNYKPFAKLDQKSVVGSPMAFTASGQYLLTADSGEGIQIYKIN